MLDVVSVARLSCLVDRLPHRLFERGLGSTAPAQSLNRMRLPVSQRPQAQVVPVPDDAHSRGAQCHEGFGIRASLGG
jgi:hypothetical protein